MKDTVKKRLEWVTFYSSLSVQKKREGVLLLPVTRSNSSSGAAVPVPCSGASRWPHGEHSALTILKSSWSSASSTTFRLVSPSWWAAPCGAAAARGWSRPAGSSPRPDAAHPSSCCLWAVHACRDAAQCSRQSRGHQQPAPRPFCMKGKHGKRLASLIWSAWG
jgi:hypothetical protein